MNSGNAIQDRFIPMAIMHVTNYNNGKNIHESANFTASTKSGEDLKLAAFKCMNSKKSTA